MENTQFKNYFEKDNTGLSFGIKSLDIKLNGIQRETVYAIGASPKVGKTTFTDFSFLLAPYHVDFLQKGKKIKWIYFSFEISRIRKMYRLAPFFFVKRFNISEFKYNNETYLISSNYLLGKLLDKKGNLIKVSEEHKRMLFEIYEKDLVPIFGKKDKNGNYIKKGVVDIVEESTNPTGLRNYILSYAKDNGTFLYDKYYIYENGRKVEKQRISGYKPNDEEEFVIIITDHIRKLKRERGYSLKENIDKWLEYQIEIRNWCKYTFVNIAHLNRSLDAIDRMRFSKDRLFPTGADFKDTGNVSEECDVIITMFNPLDEKYRLSTHFGYDLSKYPDYRSIHIIESRDGGEGRVHCQMKSNLNILTEIKENE